MFDLDGFTLLTYFYNDQGAEALLVQVNLSLHHIVLMEAARQAGYGEAQRPGTVAYGS